MGRLLLLRIMKDLTDQNKFFVQRPDAAYKLGLSSHQKITAALRQLAYGCAADVCDEYLKISESSANQCLHIFCEDIITIYGKEYLRRPTQSDIDRLLEIAEERNMPDMLGSLDCMHWRRKNCPTALAGQLQGKEKGPTVVLEAVAAPDLWIWHAFFGCPGSLNDINILDRSHLFHEVAAGNAPEVKFTVNNKEYDMGYFLADGIYPAYATLVKTFHKPTSPKLSHFAKVQEAYRKDVERAFGVLQGRFAIIREGARFKHFKYVYNSMLRCIILHNMIIESERDEDESLKFMFNAPLLPQNKGKYKDYITRNLKIRDRETHFDLRNI